MASSWRAEKREAAAAAAAAAAAEAEAAAAATAEAEKWVDYELWSLYALGGALATMTIKKQQHGNGACLGFTPPSKRLEEQLHTMYEWGDQCISKTDSVN
uniref:Uncharacterized protein n=1 Tax=Ananas comosus var. bracteatus TaxID=296719 RepID=A0A6V7NQM0_ANACO|nr:unnamed protein product [Ananas comosus var. bracteatus]